MNSEEPIGRTLLIAVVLALACSTMVSAAVYWLRPLQAAHQMVERNRAIVAVAGQLGRDASDDAVTEAFFDLNARVYDLRTAEFTNLLDGRTYDHWQIEPGGDVAERPRYVPIYSVDNATTRIVLPVHGKGMWSTVYGYIGLAADFNTVTGVIFHRHGETPGIGDRIQDPQWLDTWRGKKVYDADGVARIRVSKDVPPDALFQIDLISGASVTSENVGTFVHSWMGPDGYAPLLKRLRRENLPGEPTGD
jgi:Na+-transporting NADH:ubiquinone oxidoreductase subunit C